MGILWSRFKNKPGTKELLDDIEKKVRNINETLQGQLLCIVPLVLFPVGIILAKKLLQWYFRRKIERKNEELTDLIKQKRSVLDNVMETETYKVAKEILEKYDPETLRKSVKIEEKTVKPLLGSDADVRRRMIPPSAHEGPHASRSPATSLQPQDAFLLHAQCSL
ncbi:hypothetical protein MTO96_000289 [Rhipicephalus appendiculatus]